MCTNSEDAELMVNDISIENQLFFRITMMRADSGFVLIGLHDALMFTYSVVQNCCISLFKYVSGVFHGIQGNVLNSHRK